MPKITTNTNGESYRFINGLQICTKNVEVAGACTSAWGTLYESPQYSLGNWAESFTAIPRIVAITRAGQGAWPEYIVDATASSAGKITLVRPTSNTAKTWIDIVAFGRWK